MDTDVGIMESEKKMKFQQRFTGKWIRKRLRSFNMPEYVTYSIFAILTGALAGFGAVFFHESIEIVSDFFFHYGMEFLGFLGLAAIILIPSIGMILQSIMIKLFPKTASKKGIPEVIKAVAVRGGYIPFRTTIFHFIAPVICIGTGGTVGPEGPAAQIGGGLGSKLGNILGLSDSKRRMFTAAAAGAAISAVFNTPLGGIFFALEIILLNDFQSPTFSALILSSVTASAISRIFIGNKAAFVFDSISIGPYNQIYLFALLGLLSGMLSLFFVKYSDYSKQLFKRLLKKSIPQWVLMAIVGLIVGLCGYFYQGILGIGYDTINQLLSSNATIKLAAVLLVLKFILVPMVLNSGGFGGIFAPSLFMGACFGFIYSTLLNNIWGLDLNTATYTLVGMGAVLGGINSIPISSILIIFEMTRDYTFILPLMLAVVLSTMIVQLIMKGSVHVKHLESQGFKISQGRETNILKAMLVSDVISDDVFLIDESTPLKKLIGKLIESPHGTFYTTNSEGKLVGKITESQLRPIITEYDSLRDMLLASDIAVQEIVTVLDTDDLDYILKLFGKENVDILPVVSGDDSDKVIGTVTRQDVISAYNKESIKHNLADGLANELKSINRSTTSRVADGYSIIEKIAPRKFVGKSLAELRFRNTYELEVLMIKKNISGYVMTDNDSDIVTPTPEYIIQADDTLVMFGADEKLEKIKDWEK